MPRPVSARKQAAAAALAVAVAVPPPPPPPSCRSRRGGRLLMLVMLMLLAVASRGTVAHPRNIEGVPYATAYACEGKTLKIECREGEIIHLIRANYGRFSITICNDHGNTDWSVNCMSTKSLRVLHGRCSMNQNCSILASTTMFGDPCVSTLKYLEAHYQCIPTTMSSTPRPSPPWLITSKPVVWGSTGAPRTVDPVQPAVPAAAPPAAAAAPAASAGGHLQPPTFRPHITMPPDLRPGVVKVKNDGHSPELAKPAGKPPAETPAVPDVRTERTQPTTREDVTEKPFRKEEELPVVRVGDREGVLPAPPREGDPVVDPNRRHHHHTHYDSPQPPEIALWRHCAPALARGLAWNWTSVGEVAVQPCPGGATGLARWRCVSSAHRLSHLQQQRRAGAPHREPSGSHAPLSDNPRQLNSRDPVIHPDMTDFREELENLNLPVPLASSGDLDASTIHNTFDSDGQPVWISENPDLSECRSVWLNSLETRVKEGESLLSISNDLAQVTSSKTLYGGDMMTTTNIMKRLAQRMALNIQSFPDPRQREAIVSDMLLGVVKTGSHLLDISQQASWKDLSHPAQMRVATSLLIGLEENAFLLAEAVLREKTIIQQVDNILLSVRVLETRNVETEEFPSSQSKDQWMVSQDSIYLPRGALIDNSEGGLVRIVFVAFDRLEEILQPPESPTPPPTVPTTVSPHQGGQQHANMNRDRVKDNITRIINSKVISASLGKGRHIQLSQPVRLTLRHLRTHNVTNPTCVFWDYTINVWSSEGCRVEWSNLTHTGCQCSHLTNFALLMDVHAVALGEAHALALHIITLVGCSVSCVALAAAMLVFHLCKGMKSDRITIHKNLCLCLLLAELVFMFGVERTGNRVLCGVIAATLHYLFLAAFAWMLLEGYHLYAMLVEVFEPERARARWYYLVGYLGPLLVVGASAAADYSSYGTSQHCWLRSDNYFILSFIVPVAVVLLANWICLMMVIYMMCQHSNVSLKDKENDKQKKIKVWLKSSTFLVVVLGLTWTFGLLYLNQETILMAYLFTIFNTLQGLFIFICHCLLNENFLKECSRHRWLACCAWLLPAAGASAASGTQSSNAAAPTQPGGTSKRPRHHQAEPDQCLEDVSDHRPERALKQAWSGGNTCTRPSAPLYSPAAHSCSMPTMAANQQASKYEANRPDANFTTMSRHESSNISRHDSNGPRTATPVPAELDYGQGEAASRSRSPSCFSVKMDVSGWGVVQNPLSAAGGPGVTGTWKSTSSRQGGGTMNRDRGLADSRSYNYSRNYAHNYPHSNTYSEIGREREFQPIHRADDPVYEEIDRNETLMSDVSDDNSVHRVRPTAHHQSVMDRRPLIAQNNIDHRNRYDQYYQVHGQRYVDDARHYGHAVDAHYRRNMEVVLDGDDVASRVLHNRQIPPYNGC